MTRQEQKDDEQTVAKFFIERLNQFYGLDYIPEINSNEVDENRFTDIFGISVSGRNEKLKLQLAIHDGEIHQALAEAYVNRVKAGEPSSTVGVLGGSIYRTIINILEKKREKTTGEEILVIHNDYGSRTWDPMGAKRNLPSLPLDSPFKAVYMVIMPAPQKNSSTNFSHEGQIIGLKNIFGEDGVCF